MFNCNLINKGRNLSFGGEGGGPRELEAPKGLYFTRFGSIHGGDGIFSILAEASVIPVLNDDKVVKK